MSLNLKWPGSGSAINGKTPFALYDSDSDFQNDGPRTAVWCAKRLGYPIVDVELIDEQFYACFEEAVSEYSAQVNQFNIRNNLDTLRGRKAGTNYTQKLVDGTNLPQLFRLSQAYGTLAGVGGPTDYKKAYVNLSSSVQEYDLTTQAYDATTNQLLDSTSIRDVVKVYYEAVPAITRFFDPYSVGAQGTLNLISELGFGNYSPAAQFLLMPLYEDVLRMQHIEFNDHIRKSAFTFNIVNNNLTIFPVPSPFTPIKKIYFDYFDRTDFENNSAIIKSNVVSDYSDIKYDFIEYSNINDVGKQWIRKYTLALAKELLGAIREKYNEIPIPDATVSLDGAALRSEAQVEKDALITQLRENLEELSRKQQFEIRKNESDYTQEMLKKVPLKLYVG
ncbi:hypothetical protein UFOVP449_111 [uncultured Caudovirales phage]|uniref:Uncharacterized protein n=1 Tax=uncultured Caudovirales phage TaxID=2100421 RepID=A0A6J5MAA7_9CAUD|nr:hypothetical protein UFOVP449_111 [uncultured Caudovirales phage]